MPKLLFGIVGNKNTGKTTTVLRIVSYFTEKGLNAAIIKYSHHKFDLQPPDKDSTLLRKSKAQIVISSTPYETVYYQRQKSRQKLDELLDIMNKSDLGIDVVVCESYPAEFPPIPLIFTCESIEDFQKLRERYLNQKPLFITGIISKTNISELETFPVLSSELESDDFSLCIKILNEKGKFK
ncbi:MAG: hypothetical protein EAX86_02710 [Candidatus Heimdallarchaeota archaeon]|nr:hypothetical protein [Candidatus Heimdallarchaeota archaeon]